MKKYILLAIFLLPITSFGAIETNLRYGSSGEPVKELQEFLIDKGFLTGQATGNFYSLTKKAVIAYQASVSLPATGFVGAMTREKINTELAKDTSDEEVQTPVVNTPSNDTTALQSKLDALIAEMVKLTAESKKVTENTQQVVTNTTPAPVLGKAEVVPVIVPSEIIITPRGDSKNTMFGGMCDNSYDALVSVKYSDGSVKNEDVSIAYPDGTKTVGQKVLFNTVSTSGVFTIALTKGDIKKDVSINIQPWIVKLEQLKLAGDNRADKYNPQTYTCN